MISKFNNFELLEAKGFPGLSKNFRKQGDYRVTFNIGDEEIDFSGTTYGDVYSEIINWLNKKGYDFTGPVHNAKVRKIFTSSEIEQEKSYNFNDFYEFDDDKFIMLRKINVGQIKSNILLILRNFGIDTSDIKFYGFDESSKSIDDVDDLTPVEKNQKKLTFIEAAQSILKQNDNQPMSAREIWDEIGEQDLVETSGTTHWATLNDEMLKYSDNSKISKRKNSLFHVVTDNPAMFILINPKQEVQPGDEESDTDIEIEDGEEVTPMKSLILQDFWDKFKSEIDKVSNYYLKVTPRGVRYFGAATGIGSVHFTCVVTSKLARVEIYFNKTKEQNKLLFDYLLSERDEIESQFGDKITFERLDDKRASRIKYEIPSNVYDKNNWNDIINFLKLNFVKLTDTFQPIFDEIKEDTSFFTKPTEKDDETNESTPKASVYKASDESRTENPFMQCICILGDPGVGKSVAAIEAISGDKNHKFYLSIPTDLSTSMLLQFVRGELVLNKVSKMIIEAYKNPNIKYTVIIDEFHKPLTIKRVNDELLQAISIKRYNKKRFISSEIAESFISEKLNELGFDEIDYSFHGNIEIPRNFGFVMISSKPNVIIDNEDLYDRMDILYLRKEDQGKINSVDDIKRRLIHETVDKIDFKQLIKTQDQDSDEGVRREALDNFLNKISNTTIKEKLSIDSAILKFNNWINF